jgi:cytochrome c2
MSDLNNLFNKTNLSLILFAFAVIFLSDYSYPQSQGETIFKKTCIACHTIGRGRLVGPDLKDISKKRSDEWIIGFVKSSQGMIKSGDKDAIAIFNEYNKTVMPDQALSDSEIKDIILYVKQQSSGSGLTTAITETLKSSTGMLLEEASKNEISAGEKLFFGEEKLANGGPACISCHNVINTENISGGLLAIDLTNAFTRLSGTGINAVITNPPFPVMKTTYVNSTLTKDETFNLIAFLKETDSNFANQQPNTYKQSFLYTGLIGAVILFGIYGGIWWNRKRKAVNQKIYNRQIKSFF